MAYSILISAIALVVVVQVVYLYFSWPLCSGLQSIYLIQRLSKYVDDEFGCNNKWPLVWYAPYNDHLPPNQVSLLHLWNDLGIPHKKHKQISGSILPVIGITIDARHLTFDMPNDSHLDLISKLEAIAKPVHSRRAGCYKLKQWQ
jgi:hypothetical protein